MYRSWGETLENCWSWNHVCVSVWYSSLLENVRDHLFHCCFIVVSFISFSLSSVLSCQLVSFAFAVDQQLSMIIWILVNQAVGVFCSLFNCFACITVLFCFFKNRLLATMLISFRRFPFVNKQFLGYTIFLRCVSISLAGYRRH